MAPTKNDREHWQGKWDVLLSYIGYNVGLGNVWRFPYLCYMHGGGAFLVPYFVTLIVAAIPLYYLEIMLGQYTGQSMIAAWNFCPLFQGVSYGLLLTSNIFCVYVSMLMGYIIRYFVESLKPEVPWATCNNQWNTPACHSAVSDISIETSLLENETLSTTLPPSISNVYNLTQNVTKVVSVTAAEEYWQHYILEKSDGIYPLDGFVWQSVLFLALSLVITFLCIFKGIKSVGKVVYFTATFPYAILLILLVRALTLPGSLNGIKFFLLPDFSKLADGQVWGSAAVQVFFSIGCAWGTVITLASYNEFRHNSKRDVLISCIVCPFTSILSGFVIFGTVGFLANELGTPVSKVMDSGTGLAFVVYPEALARMPLAPLWSALFFFMLFIVGLDTLFTNAETTIACIRDVFFPDMANRKLLPAATWCFVIFLLALPLATRAGIYIITLMDSYCVIFPPLVSGFLETLLISYVYGWRRFSDNIRDMRGSMVGRFWTLSWRITVPLFCLLMIGFLIVTHTSLKHGSYEYPRWTETVGWTICTLTLLPIPIVMVVRMYLESGSVKGLLMSPKKIAWSLLAPRTTWKPQYIPGDSEESIDLKQQAEDVSQGTKSAQAFL